MKALVIHKTQDIRIEEREPMEPGPREVGIAVRRGGICGSDLHYFRHGGFGVVRLQEPMILGHEVAGEVISLGHETTGFAIGDRVAVNPSQACGTCLYCQRGQQNHCLDMLFYGSAMRMPHVQGAFRQVLIARAAQCHVLAAGVSLEEGALAEPFAVTLHAIGRAGSLAGKRVLVTGCGPIGVLVIASARLHGAQEIVATDMSEYTLAAARRAGADTTLTVPMADEKFSSYRTNKGYFD